MDAQGAQGLGEPASAPPPPVRTTGRCFADQPSLRKPGTSQLWEVFSPLRWASARGESGGHSSSQGWAPPRSAPPSTLSPRGHLTLQAVGVKLDVALAAAGGFHDHLDALPLDAGQGLRARSRSCGQAPAGQRAPAEHTWPRLSPNRARWVTDPNPLPFLGTNCDVTPTSKVAKTGEWSLVTMLSVQPGWWEGTAG